MLPAIRLGGKIRSDASLPSRARSWPIPAGSLLARQDKEAVNRLTVIVVEVNALLAARADAAPPTNECSAAEEIRLDRQLVKARHVAAGVGALSFSIRPLGGAKQAEA